MAKIKTRLIRPAKVNNVVDKLVNEKIACPITGPAMHPRSLKELHNPR
jgi:hypothetical protein